MLNVVLGTPPVARSGWNTGGVPPMSLAYLAGSVRTMDGVRTRVVDATAEGLTMGSALDRVLAAQPDLFGLAMTSLDVQRVTELIKRVKTKAPHIITLLGGYHATAFDELLLREIPELDFVMRGEADLSFPCLLRRLMQGKPVAGVAGLSYRRDGRIVSGKPQYIKELDEIPFPERSVLDFGGYLVQWAGYAFSGLPKATTVVSSRGCPNHCTFCSKLTPGSRIPRLRSAENVFREVEELSQAGYQFVAFVDENFTHNEKRVERLCRMILQHGLRMRFAFQGTLHNLSQYTLHLMHRAGFDVAFVGVESGSDAQLQRFRKVADRQELGQGIIRAKKAHIFVVASFIHGGPGETLQDTELTNSFVHEFRPNICQTGVLMLHPGSKLWERLVGPNLPTDSLDGSRMRHVHQLPGQLGKEEIDSRVRSFQRTFLQSWFNWRTVLEVIDLLAFNPIVRKTLTGFLTSPKELLLGIRKIRGHVGSEKTRPMASQAAGT